MLMVRLLATTALLATANAHGAIVSPRSRNSIDYLANVRDLSLKQDPSLLVCIG